MMAKLDIYREEIDVWLEEKKEGGKEMTAYQEAMEAYSEKIKSLVEHQEVPEEEAAVETLGTLEDRYGDRHLAAGRRRPAKKRIQGNGGSW
jgi:soluble cytochrome b562